MAKAGGGLPVYETWVDATSVNETDCSVLKALSGDMTGGDGMMSRVVEEGWYHVRYVSKGSCQVKTNPKI